MRRPRKPRSFVVFCGVAVAAAWALALPAASAQEPAERSRRTMSSTVLGTPHADACAEAAGKGVFDDAALERCTSALQVERLDRNAYIGTLVNRGAIYLRRRAGEPALADFDAALERAPGNPDILVNRGAALVLIGRRGEAVQAFTLALQTGVREPHKAYFNRGAARETLGDARGALEDYETALAIRPEWDPAEAEIARFVRSRRDALARGLAEAGQTTPQRGTP